MDSSSSNTPAEGDAKGGAPTTPTSAPPPLSSVTPSSPLDDVDLDDLIYTGLGTAAAAVPSSSDSKLDAILQQMTTIQADVSAIKTDLSDMDAKIDAKIEKMVDDKLASLVDARFANLKPDDNDPLQTAIADKVKEAIMPEIDTTAKVTVDGHLLSKEAVTALISEKEKAIQKHVDLEVTAKVAKEAHTMWTEPMKDLAVRTIAGLNLKAQVTTHLQSTLRDEIMAVCATDPQASQKYVEIAAASINSSKTELQSTIDTAQRTIADELASSKEQIQKFRAEAEAELDKQREDVLEGIQSAKEQALKDAFVMNKNAANTISRMFQSRGLHEPSRQEINSIPTFIRGLTKDQKFWHAGGLVDTGPTPSPPEVTSTFDAHVYYGVPHLDERLTSTLRGDSTVHQRIIHHHNHIEGANYSSSSDKRMRRLPIKSNDAIKDEHIEPLQFPFSPASFLSFYDALVRKLLPYNIGLTPFDALDVVKYQSHAFFLPGIGWQRSLDMDEHFYEVLAPLLPDVDSIAGILTRHESSGTKVLYHLLTKNKTTCLLDPNYKVDAPDWADSRGEINHWAKAVQCYHRVLSTRGNPSTPEAISRTFLSALEGDAVYGYAASAQTSAINALTSDPFPDSLELIPLAEMFSNIAAPRVQPALTYTPAAHRTATFDHSNPQAARHVQGFQVNAVTRSSARRGRAPDKVDTPVPIREIATKKNADLWCDACQRKGHPANRCYFLAMSILCNRWEKSNPALAKEWAAEWTAVKRSEGGRFRPLRQVARTYCSTLGATMDHVYDEMDWEFLDSANPQDILENEGDSVVEFTD